MKPADEPEGTAMVLMSVTVFQQWIDEHPEVEIVEWGSPTIWTGPIWQPSMDWHEVKP